MRIANPAENTVVNELSLLMEALPLDGAAILELGCGRAEKTRSLAESARPKHILALEVDAVQHAKNLQINDLPLVSFAHGGAEAIPAADESFDIVLMFKSLHHVPMSVMDQALREVSRVLRPGGLAWISEPVYDGEMNEIFKLFHDEKQVREAAFEAIRNAVGNGLLNLKQQYFFNTRSHFDNFEHFNRRMIQVTHTNHQLSPACLAAVRQKFESFMTAQGATFFPPQRVDLLIKP